MLSLEPFLAVDEVHVCPDHQDPQRWYYIRSRPRLGVDGSGQPALRLIKYRSGADTSGGLLSLSVDLGISEAERARATAAVRNACGRTNRSLRGEPVLVPLPVLSGSVGLIMFGESASDGGRSGALLESVVQPSTPSLFGDNVATFSARLSQDGAELLDQSIRASRGAATPLGVVYDLEYEGLKPAYAIEARVAWKSVKSRLERSFRGAVPFLAADIERVVQELREEKVIELRADTLDEASGPAAVAALDHVRALIFDRFFRPAAPPRPPPAPTGLIGLIEQLAKLGSTGGTQELGRFVYTDSDTRQLEERHFTIDLRQRIVVRRRAAPSGFLSDLVSIAGVREAVQELNLDDPFFAQRRLTVSADPSLLESDAIATIEVSADYGGQRATARLDGRASEASLARDGWPMRVVDGVPLEPVEVQYVVRFAPDLAGDRRFPSSLSSGSITTRAEHLILNPRALYGVKTVTFAVAPGFPWTRYPRVQVHARARDDASSSVRTFVLEDEEGKRQVTWRFFQRDPAREQFEYRLVYASAGDGGGTVVLPAASIGGTPAFRVDDVGFVTIEDPKPAILRLTLLAASALFERYECVSASIFLDEEAFSYVMKRDEARLQVALFATPEARESATFEASLISREGELRSLPRSLLGSTSLVLSAGLRGRQELVVQLADSDLQRARLDLIAVNVAYGSHRESLALTQQKARHELSWEVGWDDSDAVTYQVTYYYGSGRVHREPTRELRAAGRTRIDVALRSDT